MSFTSISREGAAISLETSESAAAVTARERESRGPEKPDRGSEPAG